jgi:hypothetical protein
MLLKTRRKSSSKRKELKDDNDYVGLAGGFLMGHVLFICLALPRQTVFYVGNPYRELKLLVSCCIMHGCIIPNGNHCVDSYQSCEEK